MSKLKRKIVAQELKKGLFSPYIWDGAAALSFYILLSIFPAILVLFSLLSFLPYDNLSMELSQWWFSYLPTEVKDLFIQVIQDVGEKKNKGLLSIGFVVALWTSLSGVSAIVRQLNRAYHVSENRSFIKIKVISLFLAAGLLLMFVSSFFLLLVWGYLEKIFAISFQSSFLSSVFATVFRYGLIEVLVFLIFSFIYYVGPNLKPPLKFVSMGGLVSSLSFLLTTEAFAYYLNHYADYSATYGSLGAVIGLLMWFYLLGVILIFGAEINQALIIASKKGKQ